MNIKKMRVAELMQSAISMILHRDIIDKRIGFVTITQIKIDDEYKNADVYYSVFGDAKTREKTAQGLSAANRFIQRRVIEMLKMGKTPIIRFKFDETPTKAEKLEKQLSDMEQHGTSKQETDGADNQGDEKSPDTDA